MGRLLAIALAVAAAGIAIVVVVGPGDDKPEDKSASTPSRASSHVATTGTAATAQSSADRAPVGATVRMRALAFRPNVVHVRTGESVRFVNRDDVAHIVSEDVGNRSGVEPLFASGVIGRGRSFAFLARTPGVIRFVCTLHPGSMTGRIVVAGGAA